MPSPLVTLAIPCRNAGPYLEPQLESLLAQNEQRFRLVLVDDGSTDESIEAARRIAGSRIEIISTQAGGIGRNWNRCAELVDTTYFCLPHQDDQFDPDYLGRLLEVMDQNPDAGIAHCRALAIDEHGQPFRSPAERYKEHFWRDTDCNDLAGHYARLWRGNYVCCPSVIYRTDAFRAIGPFRTDLRFALDWEYWFRLLRAGFGIASVDDVLMRYRRHPDAATQLATKGSWRFAEELAVLHEARDRGLTANLLPTGTETSPALRNILLHEALVDLQRGNRQAVRDKLAFVRDQAPELWRDPYVRTFRTLTHLGLPGRALLHMGRSMALRYGLGGGAG